MFIKEDELRLNKGDYAQRKFLPYEIKLKLAKQRIRNGMNIGEEMCI